jgi:CBS domain-containing protein
MEVKPVRIEDWMKFPVHAVKPMDSVAHARALLEQYRVNQLPVVVNRRLVGIVTDRDLRTASPSAVEVAAVDARRLARLSLEPERTPVERVMTEKVITLGPKDTIEQAARIMMRERIGSIPIVENRRLAGIITRSDVLGAFLGLIASAGAPSSNAKPARGSRVKSARSKSK